MAFHFQTLLEDKILQILYYTTKVNCKIKNMQKRIVALIMLSFILAAAVGFVIAWSLRSNQDVNKADISPRPPLPQPDKPKENNSNTNSGQMANPASQYCVDQGGRVDIRTMPDGGQTGYCIFSDGSACDEWAFFRKQCGESSRSDTESVYIDSGKVYYIDNKGVKTIVAENYRNPSIEDEEAGTVAYKKAELSPDKRFILLGSVGWENVKVEIYDLSTKKKYDTGEASAAFGQWMPDNRLRIEGECGMGISCGVYESINAEEPWKMQKVGEAANQ